MICSLVNVARAGAVKYNRKMKNSDHTTERRASRTDGVVKYRIRICGNEAVPAIKTKTSVTNFQLAMAESGAEACGVVSARMPA